jgi:hypothetical protein
MVSACDNCGSSLKKRKQKKFCSNKCQIEFQYKRYIESWKNGQVSGERGMLAKNISNHLRKYLLVKYGTKCVQCGWGKKHPVTGNVPLEIHHIDGSANNNNESNLRLLCPNCHSLTTSFKNLNSGKGRLWRKDKYLKNN